MCFTCNILLMWQQELRERVLRGKYRVPFYMSTDCEGILRRFLVLNPAKRCTLDVRSAEPHVDSKCNLKSERSWSFFFVSLFLQQVMKDKWINSGYDGEDLKPHIEPVEDFSDPARIGETAAVPIQTYHCCEDTLKMFHCITVLFLPLLVSFRGDGGDGLHFRGKSRTLCSIRNTMRSPPPTYCWAARATWVT